MASYLKVNIAAFDGQVVLLTLTAPGALSEFDMWAWNKSMFGQWSALRKAARVDANRRVGQRHGSGCLAYVPELQKRGALHLHVVLGGETVMQRRWCEAFGRYCTKNAMRYGFGQQRHLGREWQAPRGAGDYVGKLARYVSKAGGLRTMWENDEIPARAWYVSRRLTTSSGCTMRMLRRRGVVWASWRVSVTFHAMKEWSEAERAFKRPLTRAELLCVGGVRPVLT